MHELARVVDYLLFPPLFFLLIVSNLHHDSDGTRSVFRFSQTKYNVTVFPAFEHFVLSDPLLVSMSEASSVREAVTISMVL